MSVAETALSQLGLLERGQNLTPFGAWYGAHAKENWNGQPWCAMFMSWCHWKAGYALPELQAVGFSGFASCAIGLESARQLGWEVSDPAPGDLVFFGHPRINHVGLVVLASKCSDLVVTVEGNTRGPTGEDGVFMKARRFSECVAFVRPRFDANKPCHGPCWICNECPA